MLEKHILDQIEFNDRLLDMFKKNIPKLNTHILTTQKGDNFLFSEPISLDYIVQTQVVQKRFFKYIVNDYFKNNSGVDVDDHIIVLSPHETFNFRQKIQMKDYKLPLFVIKLQNTPLLSNFQNPYLTTWGNNYFMQNTRNQTKNFIIKQYKQIKQQNDPEYTREGLKDKVVPTLYYDQQIQNVDQTLNVYQETNRDLNRLFIMMNTKIFQNTTQKYQYILPIDRILKVVNEQQSEIVDRFQFPLFFVGDYFVTWDSYTNNTNYSISQDNWNYQTQLYSFKSDIQVLTRMNLQVSLLKMDIDVGVQVSEEEPVEWIRKTRIK